MVICRPLVSDLLPEVIFEFHSALATQFDHELPVAGLHLLLVLILVPLLSLNLLVGLVPGQGRAAMNNCPLQCVRLHINITERGL